MSGRPPDETFISSVREDAWRLMRGRPPAHVIGRVTNNKDPQGLRRIKVQYHWGKTDEGAIIESPWLQQMTTHGGPTKSDRRSPWGSDPPLPEVGQEVVLGFNNDDPNDPIFIGVLRYGDGDLAVPGTSKADPLDWCWKESFANGFMMGVDPEGTFHLEAPGHIVIKSGANITVECRGIFKLCCGYFGLIVLMVLRMAASKLDIAHKLRDDEMQEATELMIQTMKPAGPVKQATPIGQVQDIEDGGH
ncbi:MAG: phage baseplate assembly protein V [Blastocatellia bacterium]